MVVLKQYNDTYWSLINVNDNLFKERKKSSLKNYRVSEQEKVRISLSRTKRRIKEICLSNNFEYFVTMTISTKIKQFDRYDLELCIDNIKKLMKKIKRQSTKEKGDFKYIFITEKHQDGAYHFHGMMKNLPKDDIYINKNGYLSSHLIDTMGFNSFSLIKNYNKTCNYILKYISKDCCKTENNQIYFCSRGLVSPNEEIMINQDLSKLFGKNYYRFFENEWAQTLDFDITRLSEKQRFNLSRYFELNDKFFENENNYKTNLLKLLTKMKNNININL